MIRRTAGLIAMFAILGAACGAQDGTTHDVTLSAGAVENGIAAWPLVVEMEAADSLVIEPAGDVRDDAGHFHVMVDTGCVEPGETIPNDAAHRHFGDGSASATLAELEPGEHELCLQVGDGAHSALDAIDEISVSVGAVIAPTWRDEMARRCADAFVAMEEPFDSFFAEWEADLEAGAGPDHPDADAMVADWYDAIEVITPIYANGIAEVLDLPAPEALADDIIEMKAQADAAFAAIEEMSATRDPVLLFGDDDEFPLGPLFQSLETNGISECTG